MSKAISTTLYCWEINRMDRAYIVADTLEEAIEIYKEWFPDKDIASVERRFWTDLKFSKRTLEMLREKAENERKVF